MRVAGVPYHEGMARQARVPAGLGWLPNPVGSAPGLLGELGGRTLRCSPVCRRSMRAVLGSRSRAGRRRAPLGAASAVLLRTAQVGEAVACAALPRRLMAAHRSCLVVVAGALGRGRAGVAAAGRRSIAGALAAAGAALRARLGRGGVRRRDARAARRRAEARLAARPTVAAGAESCTGGASAPR